MGPEAVVGKFSLFLPSSPRPLAAEFHPGGFAYQAPSLHACCPPTSAGSYPSGGLVRRLADENSWEP